MPSLRAHYVAITPPRKAAERQGRLGAPLKNVAGSEAGSPVVWLKLGLLGLEVWVDGENLLMDLLDCAVEDVWRARVEDLHLLG
jgi:hypothetical protein